MSSSLSITQTIKQIDPQRAAGLTHYTAKLNGYNWTLWKDEMLDSWALCGLAPMIVNGTLPCPDKGVDPENYESWQLNNRFARQMLRKSVEESQMVYMSHSTNAHQMWRSLCSIYDTRGFQTIISTSRVLFSTMASEEDDIEKHIKRLEDCWTQLTIYNTSLLRVEEELFKGLLLSSLPPSWNNFIFPFMSKRGPKPGEDSSHHYDDRAGGSLDDLIGFLIDTVGIVQ
jgi:gag-polypeptide of LTR copia-type